MINIFRDKRRHIRFLKVLLIVFSAIFTVFIALFLVDYIDSYTLKFYHNYYGHPSITGTPNPISQQQYNKKICDFKEKMIDDFWCEFFLPKSVKTNNLFYCYFESKEFIYRYEVYLCCEYEQNDYYCEKNRLESITRNNKHPLISNNLFEKESYIFCYNSQSEFRYTVFEDDNYLVHYIWFCAIRSIKNAVFPHWLFPTKPLRKSDLAKETNYKSSFDMY